MSHLLFRCVLLLVGGFCAALAFIRVWLYDDHDLRLLITSTGCPTPCFMGIRPGLTTPDEAIVLLKQHEWVARNSVRRTAGGEVLWAWNGQQPAIINPDEPPLLIVWAANREMQVVNGIQLPLKLPVGYAFLELGEPPVVDVGQINKRDGAAVIAIYQHHALEVWSRIACPITRRKFLESPLNLFWLALPERGTAALPPGGTPSC
jgi:hypothetical protein